MSERLPVRSRRHAILIILTSVSGGLVAGLFAEAGLRAIYEGMILAQLLTREQYENFTHIEHPAMIAAIALFGAICGGAFGSFLNRAFDGIRAGWERMETGDRVTLFVGIFAGILASLPFLIIFSALGSIVAPLITVGLMLGFSALAVYALHSMEDVLPWQRGKARSRRRGIKVLDTSVIIDGRIYDVAKAGFLEGPLYVPYFVLEELQHIADSSDPLRRQRGKRGLEILKHLQNDFSLEIGSRDRLAGQRDGEVDSRIVSLALALGADIVTNDFNLNRVASLQNINVLNINDLALALRPNVLPNESLRLQIIREGNQPGQGVGYLEDGTMVVVDGGKARIGETVDVRVTQVIQTERGKLIFADLSTTSAEAGEPEASPRKRNAGR